MSVLPPKLCPLPRPKPEYTFGYDGFDAFTELRLSDGCYCILDALDEDLDQGPPQKSHSRPSFDVRFPVATIETYFLESVGIAHLHNMRNAAIMLKSRVAHLRKAGLAIPYEQAFIFSKTNAWQRKFTTNLLGIDLSFNDDNRTRLNCHWIERNEVSGKDIYWTGTLARMDCNLVATKEDFNKTRRACKNLIEHAISSNHVSLTAEIAALAEVLEP